MNEASRLIFHLANPMFSNEGTNEGRKEGGEEKEYLNVCEKRYFSPHTLDVSPPGPESICSVTFLV